MGSSGVRYETCWYTSDGNLQQILKLFKVIVQTQYELTQESTVQRLSLREMSYFSF